MKTSQTGINLIKHFEGLHDGDFKKIGLQPKKCPAGIWTEGYGSAMRDAKGRFLRGDVMPKATIKTEAEAELLLSKNLKVFENIVNKKIKVELNQNQFDALVSHTYNTGGSDMLFKFINAKRKIEHIKSWWLTTYISAGGLQLKGLIERRKIEFNLYIK